MDNEKREEIMEKLKRIRAARMKAIKEIPEGLTDQAWERRYEEICMTYDDAELIRELNQKQ